MTVNGRLARNKAEFTRDDFVAEVAFADEQGNDEHTRCGYFGKDLLHVRLLFPERFMHLCKHATAPQLRGVLISRHAGKGTLRRAVPEQDKGGV